MKKLIPNTTQYPNIILDEWISKLTGAEFKVLSIIIRQTFGWQKDVDLLSGNQLRTKTGLSTMGISSAIGKLVDYNLIIVTSEKGKQLKSAGERRGEKLYFKLNIADTTYKKSLDKENLIKKTLHNNTNNITKQTILGDILKSYLLETKRQISETDKAYLKTVNIKITLQLVVEYFKLLKNYNSILGWNEANFSRNLRAASQLLELSKNVEEAFKAMDIISIWCDEEGLSWTLETVVKHYPNVKLGKLVIKNVSIPKPEVITIQQNQIHLPSAYNNLQTNKKGTYALEFN